MKSLTDYTNTGLTNAMNKAGAFFAFGTEQFNKAKKEGVKYCEMGHGLICPSINAKQLMIDMDENHTKGIEQDIKENGIDKIIVRELYNYECFYTGEIEDAVDALEAYKIDIEIIRKAYYTELPNSDQ